MKKPFLHALGAALYIVTLVTVGDAVGGLLKSNTETIMIPMTMLTLFVLSAAVMGFLFVSEPVVLLIENRRQEALIFFGKTVGFFACFLVLFVVVLFVYSNLIL